MTEYTEHLLRESPRKDTASRFRWVWLVAIPLVAVLCSRGPIPALFYGMFIGLVQDSLSHQPIGMYGIVKTLVGYFAASVSMRFDVQNPVVTFILSFFFYFFHQFFYWVLARALLGEVITFDVQQTLIFGLLNAAVALPLFRILDKLKMAS
jgi:rod shape-determining protein MreD